MGGTSKQQHNARTHVDDTVEHERTTGASKQIMILGNLRIDLFVWWWEKCVVEKPVNPKCGK